MSRHLFWATPDSLVRDSFGNPCAGVPVRVYSTQRGGNPITDLVYVDSAGNPNGAVPGGVLVSDGDGLLPSFAGPDGGSTTVWGNHGIGGTRVALTADPVGSGGGSSTGPHAGTHTAGGSDPVTVVQTQVTGLPAALAGKAALTHAATHATGGADPVTVAQGQVTGLTTALGAKADLVAGLVPTAQIPPLAIGTTSVVASQAAMLALTAQRGDIAIRTDTGQTFILATDSPSTLPDWKVIVAVGQVTSVAGKTGAVALTAADLASGTLDIARLPVGTSSTTVTAGNDTRLSNARTPTIHATTHAAGGSDPLTLTAAQVSGLQAALDASANTYAAAAPGSVFRLVWNPTIGGWPTTRPSPRADIYFDLRGGTASTDPAWLLPGDTSTYATVAPVVETVPSVTPGDGQVVLSWTAVPGATGYVVGRTGIPDVTVASSALSRTFTGLTNGTTYTFHVQPTGVTSPNKTISGTPVAPAVGATTLTATPGPGSAVLNWTSVSGATGYLVGRDGTDASGSGPWETLDDAATTTRTFLGLVGGATYTLHVTPQGVASPTVTIPVTPTATTTPGTPGAVWLSGVGESYSTVSNWTAFRGEPTTYARIWADADVNNQTNLYGLQTFTAAGWNGVLDLAVGGPTDWADAAAGGHDAFWRAQCQKALSLFGNLKQLHLSMAHEFNNGYGWIVNAGNQANFKAAWARWYNIVQQELVAKGKNVKVVLSCNSDTNSGWTIANGLPSPQYFDILGVDFYDFYPQLPDDATWNANYSAYKGDVPRGIGAWFEFAKSIGKPLSLPEWGVAPNTFDPNRPYFVQKMYDEFALRVPADPYNPGAGRLAGEAWFNAYAGHGKIYPTATGNPDVATKYVSLQWGATTPTGRDALVPGSYEPDASTTGLVTSLGSLTTYTGDDDLTIDNAVYENMRFDLDLVVRATGLTFKNCAFFGGSNGTRALVDCSQTTSGTTTFVDCLFKVASPLVSKNCIRGRNYTLNRCDLSQGVDLCRVYYPPDYTAPLNVRVYSSYLHDMAWFANDPDQSGGRTHNDAFQIVGSKGSNWGLPPTWQAGAVTPRNVMIRWNSIHGSYSTTVGDSGRPDRGTGDITNGRYNFGDLTAIQWTAGSSKYTEGVDVWENWIYGGYRGVNAGSAAPINIGSVWRNLFDDAQGARYVVGTSGPVTDPDGIGATLNVDATTTVAAGDGGSGYADTANANHYMTGIGDRSGQVITVRRNA